MSKKTQPEAEPGVSVISEGCTTTFPDLDLELPAGVPVLVAESLLPRILAQPGVRRVEDVPLPESNPEPEP